MSFFFFFLSFFYFLFLIVCVCGKCLFFAWVKTIILKKSTFCFVPLYLLLFNQKQSVRITASNPFSFAGFNGRHAVFLLWYLIPIHWTWTTKTERKQKVRIYLPSITFQNITHLLVEINGFLSHCSSCVALTVYSVHLCLGPVVQLSSVLRLFRSAFGNAPVIQLILRFCVDVYSRPLAMLQLYSWYWVLCGRLFMSFGNTMVVQL